MSDNQYAFNTHKYKDLQEQIEDWLDNAHHRGELAGLDFSTIQEIARLLAPRLLGAYGIGGKQNE